MTAPGIVLVHADEYAGWVFDSGHRSRRRHGAECWSRSTHRASRGQGEASGLSPHPRATLRSCTPAITSNGYSIRESVMSGVVRVCHGGRWLEGHSSERCHRDRVVGRELRWRRPMADRVQRLLTSSTIPWSPNPNAIGDILGGHGIDAHHGRRHESEENSSVDHSYCMKTFPGPLTDQTPYNRALDGVLPGMGTASQRISSQSHALAAWCSSPSALRRHRPTGIPDLHR